jgi:hypothetical protein
MEPNEVEMASRTVFDEEILLWRMNGDKEDAKALLSAFSMEAQSFMSEIRQDIERCDAFNLRLHSESLHECASAIASTTVKYFAYRIAHAAESYDFVSAAILLPKLAASLRTLEEKLRKDGWLD